jgi:hypothetical protein
MDGEAVLMYLFDIGAEVDLDKVGDLLGISTRRTIVAPRQPAPATLALPAPLEVSVDLKQIGETPQGTRIDVRLFALGVVSVRIRVPYTNLAAARLPEWTNSLTFGGKSAGRIARELHARVRLDAAQALFEPYEVKAEPEKYAVVCMTAGHGGPAWLLENERALLAGILTGENRFQTLAPTMVEDALQRGIQYTNDDLLLVGWDYAVIVAPPDEYEDLLYVVELANLELLELRVLDSLLDQEMDASYARLRSLWHAGGLLRSARHVLLSLSLLHVEHTRIKDNLYDTGKIFGDWYIAKVHNRLRDRFHLADWERAVEAKMDRLESMFSLAHAEVTHRRTTVLEAMIVLLFILDLVLIFMLAH